MQRKKKKEKRSASWPKNNWQQCEPSTTSKPIVSSLKNDVGNKLSLDFEDVEKSLAKKLTDADIGAVLTCTNAKDSLRILKLAGCVNIVGSGLEPLRGSKVLEEIDLSMVGQHEKPTIEPEPLISHEVVLPILDSIICGSNADMIFPSSIVTEETKKKDKERLLMFTRVLMK